MPAPLLPQAIEALHLTDTVEFSNSAGWLSFYPRAERPRIGLILCPGGRVPASAYAPAAQGYAVFISPMPFNLVDIDRNPEQFGYYTGQLNDPAAYTARDDQQAQTVAVTLRLLERRRCSQFAQTSPPKVLQAPIDSGLRPVL